MTPLRTAAAALLLGLAAPAPAQDGPDYAPMILESCLAGDPGGAACSGVAAEACTLTEAGQSTVGLGYCYTSEWEQWDGYLNQAYQTLLAYEREFDADMGGVAPSTAEGLRDMQRAWIAYRDAACAYEWRRWGGGTGGGPASAACMMELTALQTLFLRERIE